MEKASNKYKQSLTAISFKEAEGVKEEKMKRLVRSAIRGNVDAYGQLIEVYKTYLYRTAWLYVRNEDLALDVVQESILKGFRQIKTLKEARYFKTWLTLSLIHI